MRLFSYVGGPSHFYLETPDTGPEETLENSETRDHRTNAQIHFGGPEVPHRRTDTGQNTSAATLRHFPILTAEVQFSLSGPRDPRYFTTFWHCGDAWVVHVHAIGPTWTCRKETVDYLDGPAIKKTWTHAKGVCQKAMNSDEKSKEDSM